MNPTREGMKMTEIQEHDDHPRDPDKDPALLSELTAEPLNRRNFLRRAGLTSALLTTAACRQDAPGEGGATQGRSQALNSSSRADTALGIEPVSSSDVAGAIDPKGMLPKFYKADR